MKISSLTLLSVLTLNACEVDAAPNTPDNSDDAGGAVINETAGLSSYPGAADVVVTPDGLDTRSVFFADSSLGEVYRHFHGELVAQGWRRTDLETEDDEIEADYSRGERLLEFELERDDGGFELEIDIDGDNTGYDDDDSDDGAGTVGDSQAK